MIATRGNHCKHYCSCHLALDVHLRVVLDDGNSWTHKVLDLILLLPLLFSWVSEFIPSCLNFIFEALFESVTVVNFQVNLFAPSQSDGIKFVNCEGVWTNVDILYLSNL